MAATFEEPPHPTVNRLPSSQEPTGADPCVDGHAAVRDTLAGTIGADRRLPDDPHEHRRVLAMVKRGLFGDDRELHRIGRFVVLQRVGAGGMGVVYAAYDEELDRRVALKLIRDPDMPSSERMRREAQVLARLSHPNVVQVYEVGAERDQLFIAMEYVRGATLGHWCVAQPRSWREILAVYRQAGCGLAAAHAAGLVHRDFKPDNALVGDDGRVRVVDFGLARRDQGGPAPVPASPPDLHAEAHATRTGALAGTPAYMAPEQFLGTPVDPRTDQFAFCVALWEALYGERPFGGPLEVIEGRVREPPARAGVPRPIRDALVRGLAARAEDRHPTMEAALAALDRDPRRARNRVAAVAALALGGAAWLGADAWAERDRARAAEARTRACNEEGERITEVWNDEVRRDLDVAIRGSSVAYAASTAEHAIGWIDTRADQWRAAATEACLDAELRGTWSTDTLDRARWCLDERRNELAALVTRLSSGRPDSVRDGVKAAVGLTQVSPCRDADLLARLPAPPDEGRAEIDDIRSELARAFALQVTGAAAEGVPLARSAYERARAIGWPPLVAAARFRVGRLLVARGEYAEAETELEAAYFAAARAGAPEIAADAAQQLVRALVELARHRDALRWSELAEIASLGLPDPVGTRTANRIEVAALAHKGLGELDQARALLERALELEEAVLGPDHPDVAGTLSNLALAHQLAGDFGEGAALLERSLRIREETFGPDHPDVAASLGNLAALRGSMARYDDAQALLERALAINERALGLEHPAVATNLFNLAKTHQLLGRPAVAQRLLVRALAIREHAFGPDHPLVAVTLSALGGLHGSRGEYEEARELLERALAIKEKALGSDHPDVARTLTMLASVYRLTGAPERALALSQRALAIHERALGPEHADVAVVLGQLAEIALERGELAHARAAQQRALAINEKATGVRSAPVAASLVGLAEIELAAGELESAAVRLRRALEIAEASPSRADIGPPLVGLAKVELAQGRAAPALALARRATTALTDGNASPRELAEARFTLARAQWSAPVDGGRDRVAARSLAEAALTTCRAERDARRSAAIEAWLRRPS